MSLHVWYVLLERSFSYINYFEDDRQSPGLGYQLRSTRTDPVREDNNMRANAYQSIRHSSQRY